MTSLEKRARQKGRDATRVSEGQRVPSRAALVYDRRRTSKACSICRHRKTRCDGQRPECSFCQSTGAVCDYSEALSTRLDESSLEIIQRLGKLEQRIDERFDELERQHCGNQTSPHERAQPSAQRRHGGCSASPHTTDGQQDLAPVKDTPTVASGPPSCEAIYMASHFTVESILYWPVLSENAPAVEELVRTPTMQLLGHVQSVDDSSPADEVLLPLDSDSLHGLLQLFLEHNFIKNPVLDTDELRKEVRNVVENGLRWNGGSCLVLLVCAIGSISSPISTTLHDVGPYTSNSLLEADAYFQAAQRRLGMLCHQSSLIAVQCSFLTGVYLLSTLQITAAWKAFAQASTQFLSYYLSLGKFDKSGQGFLMPASPYDQGDPESPASRKLQAVEESLYWSCLKSELELRIELSLPGSGLNEREYPNIFPSPPDSLSSLDEHWHKASRGDQAQDHNGASSPSDHRCIELGWFFYLAEIALRHIANRAVQTNYQILHKCLLGPTGRPDLKGINVQEMLEVTHAFDQQLQEWLSSLPPEMRFETPADRSTNSILRFILRGHMIDIIESVRFPAIRALVDSTWDSLPSPSDMYLNLCKEMLNNCVYRIEANVEGFYHRHQGTWLTIRSCSRSALMLLGVSKWCTKAARQMRAECGSSRMGGEEQELLRLIENLMPQGWQSVVLKVLEMTKAWAGESPDVARLRDVIATLLSDIIRDAGP